MDTEKIILQTKTWIEKVVIGCNFCPFASKPVKENRVHYRVIADFDNKTLLTFLEEEFVRLDEDESIETTIIIMPNSFKKFEDYLVFIDDAEDCLFENEYEGVYQLASFHPEYVFAEESVDDASNFTNRSPYPMLHLLREESIDKAIENYPHPEKIPERNVKFAKEKGTEYMKYLRDSCL